MASLGNHRAIKKLVQSIRIEGKSKGATRLFFSPTFCPRRFVIHKILLKKLVQLGVKPDSMGTFGGLRKLVYLSIVVLVEPILSGTGAESAEPGSRADARCRG